MTARTRTSTGGTTTISFLLLVTILLTSFLSTCNVNVNCQMIPISEVKTHPPSPPSSSSRTSGQGQEQRTNSGSVGSSSTSEEPQTTGGGGGGKPFSQAKLDTHTKIASQHLKEQQQRQQAAAAAASSSFPTVETDSEGRKIIRKDKSAELQNPAKHASDQNLLNFLLDQYRQISSSSSTSTQSELELQVEILTNIQYFAHKFENGRDLFEGTNALETILLPGLNSTHYEIRQSICSIFAIAGQNNLVVQELSLKFGVLRQLIHIISTDSMVRAKALFALSALLRNFEDGQTKFVQDGGVPILVNIAFLSETRQKSLTLLIDLIKEQKYATAASTMKNQQLVSSLKQSEWCSLLVDNLKNWLGFGQDDQLLIIDAIYSSLELNLCDVSTFADYQAQLEHLLLELKLESMKFIQAAVEHPDDFDLLDDELSNGIELLEEILRKMSTALQSKPSSSRQQQNGEENHDEL